MQAEDVFPYSQVCPLCECEVKLYFINLNEKVLICNNVNCEFPFDYEELQYFKESYDAQSDEELDSVQSDLGSKSPTHTCSMSDSASSEIDRLNKIYDSEDSQFSTKVAELKTFNYKKKKPKQYVLEQDQEDRILQQVKEIKGLHLELQDPKTYPPAKSLTNKRWIKNLNELQQMSGVKLLQPEEIKLLNKSQPAIGLGELKIDIDTAAGNSMSSINIQLANYNGVE